jgi:predicted transcriptional regulator
MNSTTQHPQVNFRIPGDLRDWLKQRASAMRRTVTAELIVAIEEHRDRIEAQKAKRHEGAQ